MPSNLNNVWASTPAASIGEELTLSSGQTCRARRIGMEGLLMAGIIKENDSLTGLIDERYIRKVRGGKGADGVDIDTKSLLKDGTALHDLVTAIDKCLPMIVESPEVHRHLDSNGMPIPLNQRKAGAVYTDQINVVDKMELFAWSVGSGEELDSFRAAAAGDVAGVADGTRVPKPTKRAPRNRK